MIIGEHFKNNFFIIIFEKCSILYFLENKKNLSIAMRLMNIFGKINSVQQLSGYLQIFRKQYNKKSFSKTSRNGHKASVVRHPVYVYTMYTNAYFLLKLYGRGTV